MDQQSTALLYGFWARTSGAESERTRMVSIGYVGLTPNDYEDYELRLKNPKLKQIQFIFIDYIDAELTRIL